LKTEKQKRADAAWYARNADRILEKSKSRYTQDADFRDAAKARSNQHYLDNKESRKEQARKSKLKTQYGLTVEDYDRMNQAQRGLCMLCQRPPEATDPKRKRLCVDHNHSTNKVRDLLCGPCNSALGLLEENTAVLARAIEYLNRHK
jgi:hypothetical protein